MLVKVVDASALAALAFGEPMAEAIAERLEGCQLVAPVLLAFELANVAVTKLRRYPDRSDAILEGHRLALRVPVERVAIAFDDLVPLAEATGLTAYDAAYLWLARVLGAELVTLDDRLEAACR